MSQHPQDRSKKTDGKPNSETGGKNDSGKSNDVKSGNGGDSDRRAKK